jgi:hypothetical protein
MRSSWDKRGQLAIFVIIAIVLVAGIVVYFLVRGEVSEVDGIPTGLSPVFNYYDECIKDEVRGAIDLAGSQGGYVGVPEYVPGSEYAPFSSQLNFLGFPVPYWYYISGNGLIKEQVPSKDEIEKGIEDYVASRVNECDFDNFYFQGFDIGFDEPIVRAKIEDTRVDVDVISNVIVSRDGERAVRRDSSVSVNSKLGKFYNLAREIYDREIEESFLEGYAVDVMRLYAPVDGVELSCASKVWKTREVVDDLQTALEANIAALKIEGDYYELDDDTDDYFVVEGRVDESVNFMFSKNWPSRVEIYGEGVDEELMVAEPVGIQEGLGIMGFCYAPYHFVYDISFPVMIQIYDNEEMFQFPVVVVVDKNLAREGLVSQIEDEEEFDLCAFYTEEVEINVFDVNLNSVDDVILSYKCFNQRCSLGKTENGGFVGKVPSCFNGLLVAKKEGYTDASQIFSTNEERVADVILDREHEVEVELEIGGRDSGEMTAIVTFERDDGKTVSAALPEFNEIKLSEGYYEVRVFVYSDSGIKIPGTTKTQCTEVPREGILGFLGSSKEECFDIRIPDTNVDYALVGGGKSPHYLLESEIQKGKVVIEVERLPTPKSLEDLQLNFEVFNSQGVDLIFNEI